MFQEGCKALSTSWVEDSGTAWGCPKGRCLCLHFCLLVIADAYLLQLGTSPLHMAAQNGHLSTAEVLLRAGISRDARTKVDRTPLHVAAQEGHLELVELLLKHSADIEAKDMVGTVPIFSFSNLGCGNVVLVMQCYLPHFSLVNAMKAQVPPQIHKIILCLLLPRFQDLSFDMNKKPSEG